MDRFTERRQGSYQEFPLNYPKKIVSVPTQQYFNGAYMQETVHDLTTKIRQREKYITSTDKEEVEGSFNLKNRSNNMHTLFYYNISKFAENLEGKIDDGTCKTTIQNINKIGWKAQLFKSADVSILGHGCGFSQYPQFDYHIHIWDIPYPCA